MLNLAIKSEFSGAPHDFAEQTGQLLAPYLTELQQLVTNRDAARAEASLLVPDDLTQLSRATEITQAFGNQIKYVVLIGIGGSYLGTQAIYDACISGNESRYPKLITLATADPALFNDAIATITENTTRPEELAICLVSKSGTTNESLANFEAFYKIMAERYGDAVAGRVVVITDENTPLWNDPAIASFRRIAHPPTVGGRYSVLSVVGMVPLALLGLDVNALREGAKAMRDQCLAAAPENPALTLAATLYYHRLNSTRVHNFFAFNPQLESLGKWYRQLLGESIGKLTRADGLEVREGILPIVSVGTFDLHSMAQLYFSGQQNIFTTFVYSPRHELTAAIPESPKLKLAPGLAGRPLNTIMDAIYQGVTTAYRQQGLPFNELALPDLSPNTLGQIMQLKMISVMLLAKLLQVNAFDQPGVEHYKQTTRQILGQ